MLNLVLNLNQYCFSILIFIRTGSNKTCAEFISVSRSYETLKSVDPESSSGPGDKITIATQPSRGRGKMAITITLSFTLFKSPPCLPPACRQAGAKGGNYYLIQYLTGLN